MRTPPSSHVPHYTAAVLRQHLVGPIVENLPSMTLVAAIPLYRSDDVGKSHTMAILKNPDTEREFQFVFPEKGVLGDYQLNEILEPKPGYRPITAHIAKYHTPFPRLLGNDSQLALLARLEPNQQMQYTQPYGTETTHYEKEVPPVAMKRALRNAAGRLRAELQQNPEKLITSYPRPAKFDTVGGTYGNPNVERRPRLNLPTDPNSLTIGQRIFQRLEPNYFAAPD
jgi:hypothetical protein